MNDTILHVADRDALFSDLNYFLTVHKETGKKLAILLINISHFRQINIVYGYQVADRLLHEFVDRLKSITRDQDYIARMGNAEFIVVIPEIFNEGHSTLAAHKFLACFNELFNFGSSQHKVTVDIGIALFPDHAVSVVELIQKAEIALLDARQETSSYAVYSETSEQIDFDIWDIEVELQSAMDNDEFEIFFQPQVSLKTGGLYGAEALIRWKSPVRGYVRPDIFIPIAEKSGQIHAITWWTINAVLRLIKDWPDTEVSLKVAVNLSAKVLCDTELVDSMRSALNLWGADHASLTLEVTESALMDDVASSFIALDELKSLGLNISIDDFGTGYSSMAYFKNIPANELKIDQSFVCYMLENPMDQHIVKTVIKMAHGFDLKVIAEGVENIETLKALKMLECDVAQGYYLARPMSQKAFVQWLKNYDKSEIKKSIRED